MRIKNYLILLLSISLQINAYSQKASSKWVITGGCCNPLLTGMDLDFTLGNMQVNIVPREMLFDATNGQIADNNGNTLFYSNGIYVANSSGDTMMNGSGLNPSNFTSSYRATGLTIMQGNLVIPFPGDSTKYYLFHETIDDRFNTYCSLYLYYSVIDMTLDAGLGGVVQKNTVLLNDSLIPGRLTACKHANGRDWWLFSPGFMNGRGYVFLITPQGIQGPLIKNMVTHRDVYAGQDVFSPDGTKFAIYDPYGGLDIWDFDRCTGDFFNQNNFMINDSALVGGVAFSSNNRYLYVSSFRYLYQYDMLATNIGNSRLTLGVYDGHTNMGSSTTFYLAQIAPDNKIYINCSNSAYDIHVINNPDSGGAGSGFCQHCIHLPSFINTTMPNFPNYFLGAEGGTVCDSLPTSITSITKPHEEFFVFPNPAQAEVYLTLSKQKVRSVEVYNSFGQRIACTSEFIKDEYIRFDVSALQSGVYYIEIVSDKRKQVKMFVKE